MLLREALATWQSSKRAVYREKSFMHRRHDALERVPMPTECHKSNGWAYIDPAVAIKAGLHNAMLSDKVRKAELARRTNVNQKQVDRILDPGHASKLDQLVIAAQQLGRDIDVNIAG